MIIPEKVRNMDKKEKFQYYLERFMSDDIGENQKAEAIQVISELMATVPLEKVSEEFGVECKYDMKSTPATMTVVLPTSKKEFTFDINVPDRDQFEGAKPEKETRPIKSMLTEEEKQELLKETGAEVK